MNKTVNIFMPFLHLNSFVFVAYQGTPTRYSMAVFSLDRATDAAAVAHVEPVVDSVGRHLLFVLKTAYDQATHPFPLVTFEVYCCCCASSSLMQN